MGACAGPRRGWYFPRGRPRPASSARSCEQSEPRASYVPGLSSSPLGLTGRSSIPEALMIEPRGRSVLDAPLSRSMTAEKDATSRSRGTNMSELFDRTALATEEGAGKAGCPPHPWSACNKKARGRTTGTGGSSGLPCAMVLRLIRDLPGDHAWLPPSSADRSANLAPASERQDHTISPSAAMPLVASTSPASIASRPAFVTTRTPLR
jgi:hypothetical protein